MSEILIVPLKEKMSERTLWLTIVQMFYGTITVVFMLILLFLFQFSKKFSYSFYRILQLDLITNILCNLNSLFSVRFQNHLMFLPVLEFLENSIPGFLSISSRGKFLFFHLQFFTALSMNIHRISSVTHPVGHGEFWTKYFKLYYVILCGISIFFTSVLPLESHRIEMENGTLIEISNHSMTTWTLNIYAIYSSVYFIILLLVGIISIFYISRKVEQVSTRSREVARKLSLITLVYGFLYSGILLWSILMALNRYFQFCPPSFGYIFNMSLGISSDLITLSLPYILLIFDVGIRKLFCRKRRKVGAMNVP
ncbi:Serpentine receptor class gamma-47 [Caenorhabditis elegans]|uniref:Serpentine receptor class gamma-47 n=1 Tax=Caenorhabditis elegans TaxID=6239 RepID=SRG47_CAEEL|nr:Serpentine receptor class gamma-47 [Caenorhabditis elegans]O17699.2 RecName: Full=Serpentine receptor class gamma-47; Short=Protein srg-47 [Caenorhabditis elegans]CAB03988.2 Serpentine receptor class gamma-47 [Caenorhabditis elegans]|eukprot:NP_506604.2 Serpentine receptor class gamma-47 [Caenorhabditis elegans]